MQTKKIPQSYEDFELNFSIVDEPSLFQEATTSDAWRSAMQREYDALIKKWNLEVSGSSNWCQTYPLQVGI